MGLFNVQIYGATTWVKPHTKWHARWNITVPFYSVADAQAGIKAWKEGSGEHLPHFRFRVIDENGHVVWSDHQPAEKRGDTPSMSNPIELQKALVLKRESVIKKLEENFEKEKTKRVEAETKEKEARQEFADFCEEHQEQIVNYVAAMIYGSGGSWAAVLEEAKRVFEEKNSYKTPESIPSRLETELEKFVRVLKMGAEDTIEVKPTQAVYDLL